jgi:hypothetical protein
MGLDRLDSRSVEHHGGVKGGSAAAQRVPLTPPWGSNTTGQAIKAANLSKNVSGMSPNTCQICLRAIQLSRPSTSFSLPPPYPPPQAGEGREGQTWMPATSAGMTLER